MNIDISPSRTSQQDNLKVKLYKKGVLDNALYDVIVKHMYNGR